MGSAAQTRAIRNVAGRLRFDLAQYRELVTFAQFGTADLDAATRQQLERGQRATEILKQGQNSPLPMEQQAAILYALANGYLDDVDIPRVAAFEAAFMSYFASNQRDLLTQIADVKDVSGNIEDALKAAIEDFKANVPY